MPAKRSARADVGREVQEVSLDIVHYLAGFSDSQGVGRGRRGGGAERQRPGRIGAGRGRVVRAGAESQFSMLPYTSDFHCINIFA